MVDRRLPSPPTPPPVKELSAKRKAAITKFLQDKDAVEALETSAKQSYWFDKDTPGTRAHRQAARADFEFYVESVYKVTATSDVYNSSTIISRTKEWLER